MNENENMINCFNALSQDWEQDCIKLDDEGCCALETDDGLQIMIDASHEDELVFYADMGEIEISTDTFEYLLQKNLTAPELRFASFYIDEILNRIGLRYNYAIQSINEINLGNLINNFLDTAKSGKEILNGIPNKQEYARPSTKF